MHCGSPCRVIHSPGSEKTKHESIDFRKSGDRDLCPPAFWYKFRYFLKSFAHVVFKASFFDAAHCVSKK